MARDDDLATPAAVAAIFDTVREGNKLLADGASDALRGNVASVRAMLSRASSRRLVNGFPWRSSSRSVVGMD